MAQVSFGFTHECFGPGLRCYSLPPDTQPSDGGIETCGGRAFLRELSIKKLFSDILGLDILLSSSVFATPDSSSLGLETSKVRTQWLAAWCKAWSPSEASIVESWSRGGISFDFVSSTNISQVPAQFYHFGAMLGSPALLLLQSVQDRDIHCP